MYLKATSRFFCILLLVGISNSILAQGDVNAIEYYIDDGDLGAGANTPLPITSGASVTENYTIPTSGLSVGFHTLHFRVQDLGGQWSMPESRSFYVSASDLTTTASIVEVRYYFDTDPGYGNGTLIPITSSTNINLTTSVNTSSLPAGHHVLHIRTLDSDGAWSEMEARPFFMDAYSNGLITGIEYFYDTDPGYGNGSTFPISPAVGSINQTVDLPTTALSAGAHELGIRMINENGSIGITDYYPINLCDVAIPSFTTNTVCVGDPTGFTDTSTGVLGGDVYSWDFDADGFEDTNTSGNQSFTYSSSGSFTASLTIDRSGCTSTTTVTVNVEPLPIADAGADQSFCTTSATLAAAAVGANELGTWSLISGSGTFTDVNDPTTTFTGITSVTNQLRWTVTNTLGGCSDTDDVMITSNQPISTTASSQDVALGETANSDIIALATINPGDVLTTTITTPPTKGIASVLPSGELAYTPNDGTVGQDVIGYQICNQCGNCTTSTHTMNILNNDPVISPEPITVSSGGMVNINLLSIISDPNNNLDPSTLRIVVQPTSGALATIDASFNLIIDYSGITFSGTDQLTIEICDTSGACSTSVISIEVDVNAPPPTDPPITVFNAVSPNSDGKHDYFEIENIEFYEGNKVVIFNRWGDVVFEATDYDNASNSFVGKSDGGDELPAGTYYYSIDTNIGNEPLTGFIMLNK